MCRQGREKAFEDGGGYVVDGEGWQLRGGGSFRGTIMCKSMSCKNRVGDLVHSLNIT